MRCDYKNNRSTAFDELQKQLKRLEKDLQVKKYDFSSAETDKSINKMLDSEFTHRMHLFRKFGKGKKFQKMNDWDYLVFKRRKQAVRKMMEVADERFSAKYPEMCVADEFINLCLPGVALTFNGLNERFYIEMAAAIWILDYLKNNGKYEEAKQLFPKTREKLDQIYLPNISDALHSDVREYSNGESAFRFFTEKIKENALYLLDEPENSLSPRRQIELTHYIEEAARFYKCQFIISTHSPFLLELPYSKIYNLDLIPVTTSKWTELENVQTYFRFFEKHRQEFIQ